MLRVCIVCVALLVLGDAGAAAQTIDCGKLLDVRTGRWLERVAVVVDNGRITAVQPQAETAGPGPQAAAPGPRTDLNHLSCLPGLMDMHVHLTIETQKAADQFRDMYSANPGDQAFRSVAPAQRTLFAGFTTVRDLGADHALNVALKRAIAAGHIKGPRMFTSGKSLATTGGHADPSNSLKAEFADALGEPGPNEGVVDGVDAARQAVRARYKEGADLVKITATGGVLSQAANSQNPQFTEEEIKAIVDTARDYGFHVAAHAHGAEGMKRAIRAGVHTIEHGTMMDDEAMRLFKQHGTWYVPTISAGRYVADKAKLEDYYSPIVRPKAAAIGPQIQATFGKAWKAGVKIAFGTDAGVFPHGENAKEFGYMVEAGMPALDAIRSATLRTAELLGKEADLGTVEAGKIADLIAVEGDPLADIAALQRVKFVMKDGKVELP